VSTSVQSEADHAATAPDASSPALPASPWIVRGNTLEALRDADAIRSRARQDAERLLRDAARTAAAIRDEARRQAIADGQAEAARLLTDVVEAVQNFQREAEAELVPLAFAIAHRILGAFPEDERLMLAASTALDEHRGVSGLRLRAAPATAAALRGALSQDGHAGLVTVDVDEGMAPGGCTLVHPRGRAAVGPLEQLRLLFAATGSEAA